MAVLMISSELPEVLGMADRVLVMHEGRISADIARADANEERIMGAALGQPVAPTGAGRMMRQFISTHAAPVQRPSPSGTPRSPVGLVSTSRKAAKRRCLSC